MVVIPTDMVVVIVMMVPMDRLPPIVIVVPAVEEEVAAAVVAVMGMNVNQFKYLRVLLALSLAEVCI